jgi:hypothetical protein
MTGEGSISQDLLTQAYSLNPYQTKLTTSIQAKSVTRASRQPMNAFDDVVKDIPIQFEKLFTTIPSPLVNKLAFLQVMILLGRKKTNRHTNNPTYHLNSFLLPPDIINIIFSYNRRIIRKYLFC